MYIHTCACVYMYVHIFNEKIGIICLKIERSVYISMYIYICTIGSLYDIQVYIFDMYIVCVYMYITVS